MICEECGGPWWRQSQLMDSLGLLFEKPVAFIRKDPCLTSTLNRFFYGKLFFVHLPQKASVLCVLRAFPPWLSLSLILAFMISRTFSWIGQVPLVSGQKEELEINSYLIITTCCFFFLWLKQSTSKVQRRHLSVISGSDCISVLLCSDEKKSRWYLWKSLWL